MTRVPVVEPRDHALAQAAVLANLQRRARAASVIAFELGVDVAEVELGEPGLMDADAQLFIQQYEYHALLGLTAETSEKLRMTLRLGVSQGKGVPDIARDLRRVLDGDKGRLRNIARTETNRAANWGRYTAWQESGIVEEKEAVATLDARVRPLHLAADGEVVPLNAPFTRGAAAGRLAPPWGPNCRCTIAPRTRLTRALPLGQGEVDRMLQKRRLERLLQAREEQVALAAAVPRVGLGAAAVRREIPGLRQVEDVHVRQLEEAWDAWPRLLLRDAMVLEVPA